MRSCGSLLATCASSWLRLCAQDFGFSEAQSFVTAPPPGDEATVKLLAIADLGYCEEDGSMTTPGNYPNPVAVQPVGTRQEIISEVRYTSWGAELHVPAAFRASAPSLA
jgi:hypothetical protein